MQRVLIYLGVAVALGVLSLLVNLVLVVLKFGNLQTVRSLRQIEAVLAGVPGDVPLTCRDKTVSAVTFDADGSRKTIQLYSGGVLTWKEGSRLSSQVRRRANHQYKVRVAIFLAVFVPLVAAGVFLTLFVSWKLGLIVVGMLVFHQFQPFYLWSYPGLSGLFHDD